MSMGLKSGSIGCIPLEPSKGSSTARRIIINSDTQFLASVMVASTSDGVFSEYIWLRLQNVKLYSGAQWIHYPCPGDSPRLLKWSKTPSMSVKFRCCSEYYTMAHSNFKHQSLLMKIFSKPPNCRPLMPTHLYRMFIVPSFN